MEDLLLLSWIDAVKKLCVFLSQASFHEVMEMVWRRCPWCLLDGDFFQDISMLLQCGVFHNVSCHFGVDRLVKVTEKIDKGC
jgi:hypothetical protein